MAIEMRPRRRGIAVDGDRLSAEMAARGLQADELAQLAGVCEDVVSRARHGQRIERNSLVKLTDALLRTPVHPLLADLTRNEKPVTAAGHVATGREGRSSALNSER